ncbi:MAG: NADP-dependent malic enzyme [Oscillospiraceae bacterium]|nr:NADP-dependent malic enzyme [Oscillospiraceae bacterium]
MSCYAEKSLKKHYEWQGKIEVVSRVELNTQEELSVAYTPGVAEPCVAIQKDVNLSYELTRRGNTVAIVTDGSAVLGLGNIGAEAAMPVMEGKAVLFKEFGGVDAIPICIRSGDIDEIVNTVRLIAGSFGGINLEDISAPRCFEIERRLKECCDIPIFHDDQHGTAIVVLAALRNALKLVGKKAAEAKIVINGAGAAGTAVSLLLKESGMNNIAMCDKNGEINTGASLFATMKGADVFIGLSAPDCVTREMVAGMNKGSIVFAMANPVPEIMPDEAKAGGAFIVGTGRSDFPNQINNVLAFPGLFRGVLDVRARDITTEMKIAAAEAIAGMVSDDELCPDYIIPSPLNRLAAKAVAKAVAEKAASQ